MSSTAALAAAAPASINAASSAQYRAYGAVAQLFHLARMGDAAPGEVLVKGPAGTGKTRGILEFANWVADSFPDARVLLLRKTRRSLTESAMAILETEVHDPAQGVRWQAAKQRYYYPQSRGIIAVAGLDKASKVMSSQWDVIIVPEATELAAGEWEMVTTRLRNGKTPFQMLVADANPDAPFHWLNQRAAAGKMLILRSTHEDNPTLWDRVREAWTERGKRYIARLDELTGVRYLRLRLGLDAAAEGMVYEDAWDRARCLVPRAKYSDRRAKLDGSCGLDVLWPRYLGIDWGYQNPCVLKWYAKLPDGQLLVYREMYQTKRLVEDLAREALALMGWQRNESGALLPTRADADPLPREIIADHDAEDRATFERHFGLAVYPADKGKDSISDGIQAVTKRLQDGRLLYLEGSLVQRDVLLETAKKPCSSVEEFESYVWDTRAGRSPKEVPIDDNNHGMDVDRYVVTYFDRSLPTARSIPFEAMGY